MREERRKGGGNAEEERRERVPGDGIAERHQRGKGKRWEHVNGGAAAERDEGRAGRWKSGPTDEWADGRRGASGKRDERAMAAARRRS